MQLIILLKKGALLTVSSLSSFTGGTRTQSDTNNFCSGHRASELLMTLQMLVERYPFSQRKPY
jgi:hypothetical protein